MWKPLLLSALVLAQPLAARAAPSLDGQWALVPGSVQGLDQALDTIMEAVPGIARGFVRPKIAESLKPFETLGIALESKHVVLSLGTHPPLRAPIDGSPVTYQPPGAKRGTELHLRMTGPGTLEVVSNFEHGKRETRYQLAPDGRRFTYVSTLSSEKMQRPASYQASYQRAR